MHPKNSFQLRLLVRLASSLLLLVGPCVAYNLHAATALNEALVADGVEVQAQVINLEDVTGSGGVQYSKGKDQCAFTARFTTADSELTCRETFPYACPQLEEVAESPVTYLPADPSRCRILSRAAVKADGGTDDSLTTLTWLMGLALLAFLASFLWPKARQTSDEDPVQG